ncbi:hypothetical protein [Staphylococcus haemolyticus]|uniref:hypothetical protein n=1 Tax=Staphylococcus haemolyticus TaxID=1283 RepID=UPI002DBD42F3|nr:hypothetical protein [Staphylococcus haemolyticus]MEB5762540.1 hypothetical protein [Staphylococcus haemolyticus]
MKLNSRYLKVFTLYMTSTLVSTFIISHKPFLKILLQGMLGYSVFALGLKYLTLKKRINYSNE